METEKVIESHEKSYIAKKIASSYDFPCTKWHFHVFLSFVTLLKFQSTSPDKSSNKGQRKTMKYVKTFVPFQWVAFFILKAKQCHQSFKTAKMFLRLVYGNKYIRQAIINADGVKKVIHFMTLMVIFDILPLNIKLKYERTIFDFLLSIIHGSIICN